MIKSCDHITAFCIASDNIVIHSGCASVELMFVIIHYITRALVCQEALERLFTLKYSSVDFTKMPMLIVQVI